MVDDADLDFAVFENTIKNILDIEDESPTSENDSVWTDLKSRWLSSFENE